MTILVTGHTGFIGRILVEALAEKGCRWIGASRSTGQDLCSARSLDDLPPADWVVHLAARTSIMESWKDPAGYHGNNVSATLTALEYARRHGSRMLYLSSYMYGIPQHLPIDENHPVAARNPYAWSKLACELTCQAYAHDFNVPVVALRPFNVYGPGQPEHQLVPYLVRQAMTGDTISLADLRPRRDWLWLGDLVTAIMAILDGPAAGFEVFNIGYGASVSVQEVLDQVLDVLGPRRVVCRNEERPNEILDCVCDWSRLGNRYGWKPEMGLAEGIAAMIAACVAEDRHKRHQPK
jgi:nucleoside-diphosphate-sugar epimerase